MVAMESAFFGHYRHVLLYTAHFAQDGLEVVAKIRNGLTLPTTSMGTFTVSPYEKDLAAFYVSL